jgi:hypothetical protein
MARACLTFDIDWAHDAVIADAIALVTGRGLRATWFVTHATEAVAPLRETALHDLGLHPNFNPLLEGKGTDARKIMAALGALAPGARAVRSHSLVSSSWLSLLFKELGFTHESNTLIPQIDGATRHAWRDWTGLVQVPIRWEDDIRLVCEALGDPVDLLGSGRIVTYDFHPIHIYLNTVTLEDYESARPHMQSPERLVARRRPAGSGGSRDRFLALISALEPDDCILMRDITPD